MILFELAYLTIGSWIGFICHRETLDVVSGDNAPEATDRLIAGLVTFAAIIGWIVIVPIAIVIQIRKS